MVKFAGSDLCWIKRATANGVLYELLRCKLTGIALVIDVYHSLI